MPLLPLPPARSASPCSARPRPRPGAAAARRTTRASCRCSTSWTRRWVQRRTRAQPPPPLPAGRGAPRHRRRENPPRHEKKKIQTHAPKNETKNAVLRPHRPGDPPAALRRHLRHGLLQPVGPVLPLRPLQRRVPPAPPVRRARVGDPPKKRHALCHPVRHGQPERLPEPRRPAVGRPGGGGAAVRRGRVGAGADVRGGQV